MRVLAAQDPGEVCVWGALAGIDSGCWAKSLPAGPGPWVLSPPGTSFLASCAHV